MDVEAVTPMPVRPVGRTVFRQTWAELTFVHWAVDAALVAPLLPTGVRPDTLDGCTYVGLVPFWMRNVGVGRTPPLPYLGSFCETNVRLYTVDSAGRRGVTFLSLDASRLAPVLVARWSYHLPYVWSRMTCIRGGDRISYRCRRRWPATAAMPALPGPPGPLAPSGSAGPPGVPGSAAASCPSGVPGSSGVPGPPAPDGPFGAPALAATSRIDVRVGDPVQAGPLENVLTARWGLHLCDRRGRTRYWPNSHQQWPLRAATIQRLNDHLVAAAGFPGLVERPPDSVLFSTGVDAVFGPHLPA